MPDQAYFDDFREAVQRNDGDIVKRIEALGTRLDKIEQAVAQPVVPGTPFTPDQVDKLADALFDEFRKRLDS